MSLHAPDDRLIGEIYEASSFPKHWQIVVKSLAHRIKADSATLIFRDFENPEADVSFVYSTQSPDECSQMIAEYEHHYHKMDPMWTLAAEHVQIGVAVADNKLGLSRSEYEALCPPEYLEGFMRKYDRWYIAGSYIFQDEEKALAITLQRGIKSLPWSDQEMDYLTSLTPHFQRAFRIHREFIELRRSEKNLKSCINRLLIGVVIIRPNGKIAFINDLAERIIKTNPVLINKNGQLKAAHTDNDQQLQKAIRKIRLNDQNQGVAGDNEVIAALSLRLDTSTAPLPILITPARIDDIKTADNANQSITLTNYVAVFFAEPERTQKYSQEAISQFYGLTRAEAGVAIAISNGYTVAEYASSNNVTEYTVRTQIKQIFQKLDISRQAEIVKVLLNTPNITLGDQQPKVDQSSKSKMIKNIAKNIDKTD